MMSFLYKVAYGPVADLSKKDQLEWASNQVQDFLDYGKSEGNENHSLDAPSWPDFLKFDLASRIEQSQYFKQIRVSKKALQKNMLIGSASTSVYHEPDDEIGFKIWECDQLRLAHQGAYTLNPVLQRLMLFWWNHFTVGGKSQTSKYYTGHLYFDVVAQGMNGFFNDLLFKVTKHPAMLSYLDNVLNVGKNSLYALRKSHKKNIGMNDNLARELLELHTISNRMPYSETDIRETAKILSGWGFKFNRKPGKIKALFEDLSNYDTPYVSQRAEPGTKIVLGHSFSAGPSGLRELADFLANQDATIHHIATRLCQHFVSDSPSHEDVAHVIKAWQKTNGFLPSVHKAVLERAFKNPEKKIQWPLIWFFSILRSSGVEFLPKWHEQWSFDRSKLGVGSMNEIYSELGQNFWSKRQPDGFSLYGKDWISSEFLDRRLKISAILGVIFSQSGKIDDLIKKFEFDSATKALVSQAENSYESFVLWANSPEMMGL